MFFARLAQRDGLPNPQKRKNPSTYRHNNPRLAQKWCGKRA